ncbi:ABC transporter ATP-binding protein [Zhongshania sp.]|uniref:ABC transporter ATP-binding protein n=1 Tax=Zhongshania sp. TaxID=1971902 RepID=UPI003568F444
MLLSIKDLRFHYPGDSKMVLDIPQWSVKAGEQVFLHGPSGVGKSTFLKLLAGLLVPSGGSITMLEQPLQSLRSGQRDKWRARHIGFVFQQFNLVPYLSGRDNIHLAAHFGGKGDVDTAATTLLASLGLDEKLRRKPAAELSIGQQQRVAIARALINQPELLIVDEPTSALDAKNCDLFMALLREQLAESSTALVFVSHDLSLANDMSRVESLEDINQAGRGS